MEKFFDYTDNERLGHLFTTGKMGRKLADTTTWKISCLKLERWKT
jgi:hypothetical protein